MYPYPNQSKEENKKYGLKLIYEFCKKNKIEKPNFVFDKPIKSRGLYQKYTKTIYLDMDKTKKPVLVPGYSWSFTGYKADLTPAGILCHEFGHHVDFSFGWVCRKMKLIEQIESRVSSYEPNIMEVFAEAFRLFMTNPDLLQRGRKMRYNFFYNDLNLRPVVNEHWKTVLGNADEKIIKAAENWINK